MVILHTLQKYHFIVVDTYKDKEEVFRERQRRRKKNAAQIYPSILNVFRNRSARYAVYDVLIRYHFYQSCDEQCFLGFFIFI